MIDALKAPFPWFGGKSRAAEHVWAALGDVAHYVEPFAGSLAVLLNRPHVANRAYYSETVNDLDGLVVNAWRAMQRDPEAVAEHASWPVSEIDITARQVALVSWRDNEMAARMAADPEFFDAKFAGWWLYGICAWIGGGWCGSGPWVVQDGVLRKSNGGVSRRRPHLSSDGSGVHSQTLRESGVFDLAAVVPHPVTMPKLLAWMRLLSARLRHVRIVNGSWERVCTSAALKSISVRAGKESCGVFLDPPYADTAQRAVDLYAVDSLSVAHDVRKWCLTNGSDPKLRIVLAGFDGEHGTALVDAGWRELEWFTGGWLSGGMGHQQHRERLWLSPHCLQPESRQTALFG